ncbi:hypothetical protein K402DRAFT_399186 [Aulographum hederae CBS 113979]|uniref:Uncharacterized protein n=1 Tax=Aulographum hederae CBS 113979 TaxID=1176131 RepID=A0A6G1GIG4_9PEZI|nr:hypothetical protein K402DRAFT_399186 [Aulographum hederae CBS 113979]
MRNLPKVLQHSLLSLLFSTNGMWHHAAPAKSQEFKILERIVHHVLAWDTPIFQLMPNHPAKASNPRHLRECSKSFSPFNIQHLADTRVSDSL